MMVMDETHPTTLDAERLERHARGLRRLARSLVAEADVEDVVQEALLALLARSGEVRTSVRAFLGGVARNVSRKLHRSRARRRGREAAAALPEGLPSAATLAGRIEERRAVLEVLDRLPEPYRRTVWLRYFEDVPPREIARRTGRPVSTVKSHLARGLAQMRAGLDSRHGGSRERWRAAFLPLALTGRLAPLATEVLVKKVTIGVVALLLLLLGGAILYSVGGGGGARPDAPAGRLAAVGTAAAEEAGAPVAELDDGSGDASAGGDPGEEAAASEPPAETGSVAEPAGEDPAAAARPAVDWDPRDPVLPPGVKIHGGGGGPRIIGWSKFAPLPPDGKAGLEVTVTDAEGAPVAGAEVRIGPPGIVGENPISFAHLKELGKTDERGVYVDDRLPEGRAGVFADAGGLLRRPRGADCTSAVAVLLRVDGRAKVTIALPMKLDEVGALAGRVLTPGGDPIASAQVSTGFHRVFTDVAGRFRLARLPAGRQTVSVSRWGHEPVRADVDVPGGGTAEREFTLAYRNRGSFDLTGVVTAPDGSPVPRASISIGFEGANGTLRSTTADETGRYRMEDLPDDVATRAIRMSVFRLGYKSLFRRFEDGFPGPEVDVAFEEAHAKVKLAVRDAASREPILSCRIEAATEARERPYTLSAASREGVYEMWLPAGSYDLLVEAPDHEALRRELTVAEGGGERTVTLTMAASPGPGGREVLEVIVVSLDDGAPVTNADVWSLTTDGEPIARVDGPRAEGRFRVEVPRGESRIRVVAAGYETREEAVRVPDEGAPAPRTVKLRKEE